MTSKNNRELGNLKTKPSPNIPMKETKSKVQKVEEPTQEEIDKDHSRLVKEERMGLAIVVIIYAVVGFFIGAFVSIVIKNFSGAIPFITNTGFAGFVGMVLAALIGYWINRDKPEEDDEEDNNEIEIEVAEDTDQEDESESSEKDIKEEDYF